MGNINPAYFDRVRYTLKNKNQGSVIITEPIGFSQDEKELARHEQYHGIVSRFSNSSKYVGDGKDFIQLIYDIEGINAEIELIREEKHPQTDLWTLTYSGYLDLSTWEKENDQVSIKFNSGGLEQLLKSRESEQVEIDRTTSMDGKALTPLNPITVALDGRRIFLKTKYEVSLSENIVVLNNTTTGQTVGSMSPVPLKLINKSHESAQQPISSTRIGGNQGNRDEGVETGLMFFAISDKYRELHVKFNLSFRVNITRLNNINWFNVRARFVVYKDGMSYNLKSETKLFDRNDYNSIQGQQFSASFDQMVTLYEGESLALVFDQTYDGRNGNASHLDTNFENISCEMFIDEDSFFDKSTTKAVLYHELMDKLVAIDTNKEKSFYSDFLGRTDLGYSTDGIGAYTGVAHGFWIREFDKLPIPTEGPQKIENLFKPLTTSFRDAVSSLNSVWNIGIGIEAIGKKERVRLEELSYFYNNNVTIRLGQVKNVKRSVASEYYYSGLEFGNEKGGTYEEACGLDEPNAISTFTTIINKITQKYTKISKFRTDSYGMEFARRKPKYLNDTEDTSYDNDVFLMDLKKGITSVFEQRKWQDDFSKEPTGIFSPGTATNLRYSPFNCLLRHSWWFGAGFKKYLTDYVRYGSSTANSQLKTQLIGKNEYAENGDIINSELVKPRFFPEWIEFEYACDFNVMQMVEGSSVFLGKEVKNFYGLVEFTNEFNEKEKGFLFNLKPNGRGQWKILKSNR